MSSRIPPLLEPYLALPPEASLILLTSVLGASSNWLVLRFLHSALIGSDASSDTSQEDEAKVVFVSFMRDLAFWKENAKRLVGVFGSHKIRHIFTSCCTCYTGDHEAEILSVRDLILTNMPQRRDLPLWMV